MALATQCPHCQTTFRVANDQLKLRAGLVRCGACREVFNGIEHLVRPDHSASADTVIHPPATENTDPSLSAATAERQAEPSEPLPCNTLAEDAEETLAEPAAVPEPAAQQSALTASTPNVWHRRHVKQADHDSNEDDPLQRMTLFQVAPVAENEADAGRTTVQEDSSEDDELDRLIDELQNKPWRGKKTNSSQNTIAGNVITGDVRQDNGHDGTHFGQGLSSEPSFMQQARRKQRVGGVMQTGMRVATVLLLAGLIGQAAYTFRDQLAARVPQLKPMLQGACSTLGCKIGLPMKIDGISIESNELQAIAPARNLFVLNLLMRNRSSTVQAWPHIELTLNDASEKAIVRRVFAPRDYLPAATDATQGFARDTEQSVKMTFELLQFKASGYRVYLFYP